MSWIRRLALPRYSLSAVTEDERDSYVVVRVVIGFACAYESFALATKRAPTLSHLCRTHRWIEGLLLAWLVLHFHYLRRAVRCAD